MPLVDNGQYTNCEISKEKTKCDLECEAGYIPRENNKWVCKNEGKKAVIKENFMIQIFLST